MNMQKVMKIFSHLLSNKLNSCTWKLLTKIKKQDKNKMKDQEEEREEKE